MKVRHIVIIIIFVLINFLIIKSLDFKGDISDDDKLKKELFVPTLRAQKVVNESETLKVVGFGTISSFNAVDISSEAQGQLKKGGHHLKPGANFRKGDLLFKINDTEAQYNLRARKSGFINILASLLPDLKIDFPNEFDKWENYIGSIKLNEGLAQLPSWTSNKEKIFLSTRNVLTEYFAIKSLETQIDKYAVYAPFSGVITDVYASDFSIVGPGTKVLRVVETDNFEIPVAVPAIELSAIKIGTSVTIYSTTGVLKGKGEVVRVSEVINKNTQSVEVYVRPKSIEGKEFTEGEYVKVEIDGEEEHTGIRIAKNAIVDHSVYIYSKKDSLLIEQPVTIYDTNDEGVFVKGIKDNSIVIVQEVLNFTDSSKYQVLIK